MGKNKRYNSSILISFLVSAYALTVLVSQVFMMTKPTDIRLEKNRTFLNRLEWLDLLKDTFDKKQILTYPKNTHALYEFGQQLFVVKI